MNIAVAASPPAEAKTEGIGLHRFTVAEYQRMAEAGVLEGLRVELLDGWIIDKKMRNPPHDSTVARLSKRLIRLLSDEWVVRGQSAVVTKTGVPEPDVVVARGPEDVYNWRHPGPKDTALLVEVSDATLSFDRNFKGSLYARGSQFTGSSIWSIDAWRSTPSRKPASRRPITAAPTTAPANPSRSSWTAVRSPASQSGNCCLSRRPYGWNGVKSGCGLRRGRSFGRW